MTYADGARNAEALMVHPKTGRVYIASKNEDGGGLYEGPAKLTTGSANVFRRVGEVPWVTDGAFSPDGTRLVLRSYFSAREYAFEDGRLGEDRSVAAPFQRQAESVTYTADGSALMFGSEGARSDVVRVETEGGGGGSGGGQEQGSPRGAAARVTRPVARPVARRAAARAAPGSVRRSSSGWPSCGSRSAGSGGRAESGAGPRSGAGLRSVRTAQLSSVTGHTS